MSAIWLAPALNNLTVVRIKIYLTYTESLPALSGTLTFNAGELTKTIHVSIVDTDNVELTETLQVQLSNLQDADNQVILSDPAGEISILDDDQATLSIDDLTVNENDGTAQLTVSLDQIVETTVFVDYSTADQTAIAGTDYQQTGGTLTFNPGETTKTVTINLIDNDQIEIDETFLVNLSQLQTSAAVSIADSQAIITIQDNEQATISVQDVIVNEAAGKALVTVSLDKAVDGPVSLDYSTLDQSATASSDYLAETGTLTFTPGTLQQTIEIDLVNGDPVELAETFEVRFSNLQAGAWNVILPDDRATVTIKDDDLGDYEFKNKLYAEGTLHDSDRFGADPEIDGDTLITGAIHWHGTYPGEGAALIYVRNDQGTPEYSGDDTWDYQATLSPPDADSNADYFGWSVDISGDTAVVGALFGDGSAENMGAVYVYTRSNGEWSFQQKLTVPDTIANGYFGDTLAIEGDTLVVGAQGTDNYSGSAYIFQRENGVWTKTASLTADSPEENARFAEEIEIDHSTIVIGAVSESGTYSQSGAVYIYTEQAGTWTRLQKLTDPDPSISGAFGNAVDIQGDLILVGATSATDKPLSTGKAVLFQRDPDSGLWTSLQTLTASDSALNSLFGNEVEIHDQQIIINSYNDPTGIGNTGAVYVFGVENQTWVEQQKISYPDSGTSSDFGRVLQSQTEPF
ncbi:Calx-beta domain protein [Gimesia panareensis]|uniref:Calx-beta domain protein n=1 Tax=Gimesia panareensis TaxID=2527978 RepID=A0A518FLV2_9PLAN|nr:Calx-beta domain-containing protein [Gimesia panareensis]QDV17338.1 Calx-beta domain protein [Gimesia panareensis]